MKRTVLALAMVASLFLGTAQANPCNEHMNRSAPDSRYLDNGNGTVTDRRTGLTWQRCPLGSTFGDGGTPGFSLDDRCTATGTGTGGETRICASSSVIPPSAETATTV